MSPDAPHSGATHSSSPSASPSSSVVVAPAIHVTTRDAISCSCLRATPPLARRRLRPRLRLRLLLRSLSLSSSCRACSSLSAVLSASPLSCVSLGLARPFIASSTSLSLSPLCLGRLRCLRLGCLSVAGGSSLSPLPVFLRRLPRRLLAGGVCALKCLKSRRSLSLSSPPSNDVGTRY